MFDRELCCRQLRYSGMMETIRIRRAGYPIRHTFMEFTERYRHLINGCPPAHKVDCRQATSKICSAVLGKADYQLGRTKVFLKDAHDLYLEQERDRVLTRKILVLQRCIRGWYHRRRFLKMKAAAILIQKTFRAHNGRRKYLLMRTGYMRMQALIRSRILSHKFRHLRGHIVRLQARCRGALIRRSYEKKLWAVIKIQSHVRTMIAMRQYRKLKVSVVPFNLNSQQRLKDPSLDIVNSHRIVHLCIRKRLPPRQMILFHISWLVVGAIIQSNDRVSEVQPLCTHCPLLLLLVSASLDCHWQSKCAYISLISIPVKSEDGTIFAKQLLHLPSSSYSSYSPQPTTSVAIVCRLLLWA